MMAIAFLGYNYSPKWSKFNNYKFNNKRNVLIANILVKSKFNTTKFKPLLKSKFPLLANATTTGLLGARSRFRSPQTICVNLKFGERVRYNSTVTEFLSEYNLKPVYCYEDLHLDSTRKKNTNKYSTSEWCIPHIK